MALPPLAPSPAPTTPAYSPAASSSSNSYRPTVVPRARQNNDSSGIIAKSSDQLAGVEAKSNKILDDKFRQRVDAAQAEFLRQAEEKKVAEQIQFPYFSGDIESLKGIINDSIIWLEKNDERGKLIFELAKANTEESKVKIEDSDSKEIKDAKKAYILLRRSVFVTPDGKSDISTPENTALKNANALAAVIKSRMGQIQLSRKTSNKVILDNLKEVNPGWVWGIVGSNDGSKIFKYNNREYSAFGIIKGFLDGNSDATQDLTGYMKGKQKTKLNIPSLSAANLDKTTLTIIGMIANNENIFSTEGRNALASTNAALSQEVQKVFQGNSIQKDVLDEIQALGSQNPPPDFLTLANDLRKTFSSLGNSSNPNSRTLIKSALKIYFLDYFSNLSGDLGVAFNERDARDKKNPIQLTEGSLKAFKTNLSSGNNPQPKVGGTNTTARLNGLLQAYNDEAAKQDNIVDKIAEESGYKKLIAEYLDGVLPDTNGAIQLSDWSEQYIAQAKIDLAKTLFAAVTFKDGLSIQEKGQGRGTDKTSEKDATQRALTATIFDKVAEATMAPLKKKGEAAKAVQSQVVNLIPTNLGAA